MSKIKRKKNISSKIMTIILIIITIAFLALTFMLNVLPLKYMIILFIVLGLIDILLIKLVFSKRKYRKITGFIISIIISLVLLIGSIFEINTLGFFGNFDKYNYKTLNFNILVLKDSNYKKINDLKNKKIGIYVDNYEDEIERAVEKIENKIDFKDVEYKDASTLVQDLVDGVVEAILIEESIYSIIEEQNPDLSKQLKSIYTISINTEVEEIDKGVNVTKDSFNIYISGIDSYGKITSVSRSDVNIIATVNPKTNEILLTSIPRDYYVQLHDTTGYKDKLTHAGVYGIDTSVKTLEDLLDTDINYYIKVNFTSLIKIVDELGGITVNSNYSFSSADGYRYYKGENELNGKEALSFVRDRKSFKDGDRVRGENQQAVLEAIINKALSPKIITKYNSLLNSLEGSFVTNMDDSDITSLIKKQLENNKGWSFSTINLEGTDAYDYTHSHSASKLYVMVPDEESVENAKTQIKNIIE